MRIHPENTLGSSARYASTPPTASSSKWANPCGPSHAVSTRKAAGRGDRLTDAQPLSLISGRSCRNRALYAILARPVSGRQENRGMRPPPHKPAYGSDARLPALSPRSVLHDTLFTNRHAGPAHDFPIRRHCNPPSLHGAVPLRPPRAAAHPPGIKRPETHEPPRASPAPYIRIGIKRETIRRNLPRLDSRRS